ncbi:MAG: cupin domain-containing protein [Spirochaetes bacterium]|nr:cupin domain-containing protein [Spirochaetota bacterium]
MGKAFVKNFYDLLPAAPARHLNAHAWAFALPATTGTDSYNFFSICEIKFGGAAIPDVHKDADHCYFFLSGKGYSIIEGKRYEYKVGDLMWIPGNKEHEMYPIGVQTLKFLVTLSGKDFKQTEPFVRNVFDVECFADPVNSGVTCFPMATPKSGTSTTIDFQLVEILPGSKIAETSVADADQNTYIMSGKGHAIVDGEALPLGPEDSVFIPRGSKYSFVNSSNMTLRLAQTFGPARASLR